MTAQHPSHDAGQMRLAGGVMAAAMVLWLAANWAGQRFGWAPEYAFLADLAAIGALVWALPRAFTASRTAPAVIG